MNEKLKIVFFGTPKFVIPVLQVLCEDFVVVAVVTTPDSPVQQYAQNFTKIKNIFCPQQSNSGLVQQLVSLSPDLFVTAAYGKILPQEILDIPRYGSLNIHPSLLPKYRGPSPLQATILNGDTESGVSILLMDAEVDHGPILAISHQQLVISETFETLAINLFSESAKNISGVIRGYVIGNKKQEPQDHTKATFTKHIERKDGFIDINNPPAPEKIDRMIRAYYPWPGVWTKVQTSTTNKKQLTHNTSQELEVSSQQSKVVKLLPSRMVQVEGKKVVDLETFTRGYPEAGEKVKKLFDDRN